MTRIQGDLLSQIVNSDFTVKSKLQDFPKEWLPIGGNSTSSWRYKQGALEVINQSIVRAGIVQTAESSLDVRRYKHLFFKLFFRSVQTGSAVYLRLYPINSYGDVKLPLEYCIKPNSSSDLDMHFKQTIHIDSETKYLRLEIGVEGPGHIELYKIIAYPIAFKKFSLIRKKEQPSRPAEHIQSVGEILKPIQLATPIPLNIPVNVQAKVNSDIRNLTPLRDSVQIFGSSQVPLATTSCGRAQVEISGHGFQESFEDVTANQSISFTTIRDVGGLTRYSYAVYNMGSDAARVQIQLSPDGLHWVSVGSQQNVEPGTLGMITSEGFLRYARVSYQAEVLTVLRVWVQAQN